MRLMRTLTALCLLGITGLASATNYTLWINGRTGGGTIGDYNSFTYWGPSPRRRASTRRPSTGTATTASHRRAAHPRRARLLLHRQQLVLYRDPQRGRPDDGLHAGQLRRLGAHEEERQPEFVGRVRQFSDGTSQTGWNIKWVRAASGAGGGSELADYGSWAVSDPLTQDLKTDDRARHVQPQHHARHLVLHVRRRQGHAYSGILPGQDDEAVAYHSSGGVAGSSGGSYCNPSDWFCNDLTSARAPTRAAVRSGATTRYRSATTAKPTTITRAVTGRASCPSSATRW
jgi:hypothetical protein